ncbi:sphingomyelin phosphodiesterase 1 isoform X2 [Papilio machaon]|uniref:sphingomyelin phosphodiesterase 1 isoform X1 n=1 Tax=Papilio machaon TaxID=76193 RepID=UPI001E66412C|nr:sphingomyelin phosphodiesterase 1 isoform X1 [Papilio machaon]XP_045535066.1 sphingomyelin phosphodiesterase 1 isoform X2 [Papilio machaon]
MKVFFIFFLIFNTCFADFITPDVVETVIGKYMKNELLSSAEQKLQEDVFEILKRTQHVTTHEYRSDVRMSLDCLVCRSAFSALFELIRAGASDDDLIRPLSNICVLLGIESYNVCSGAISLNLNIITYIIRNTPEATPRNFCGLVLQRSDNPNFCSYNDSRFEWQVELPQRIQSANIPTPVIDQSPLTVAILTDAHIDPLYEAFGVAQCDEPTCCRKGQNLRPSSEIVTDGSEVENSVIRHGDNVLLNLGDVPKIKEIRMRNSMKAQTRYVEPAGYWGDYRNCDTPRWAFDDLIERMASTHKFDVVYYIGDTIDHGIWETSYELIDEIHQYLISKMRTTFGEDVLIIPAIGNHESQPTNQFAPMSVTEPKLNTTWLYEGLIKKWDPYLTEEAKASLRVRGGFSRLVRPGLRAISINTNVAYKYNWWLVYDPLEMKRHLEWLVQELHRAELAGEKVHILSHIPPGVHDLAHVWTREYNRIVNRFSSTIAAEFNGHIHSDEFKIFYSSVEPKLPINVAWGVGGATAYTNYNLNYKIATFNPPTYAPQSIKTFIYNLTEANLTPNRRPHWFQLYDMKNSFGVKDLSAQSMDDLLQRMVTTERNLLDLYVAYVPKLSDTRWPYCNNNCKLDNVCRIVTTVLWQREKCDELQFLYSNTNT